MQMVHRRKQSQSVGRLAMCVAVIERQAQGRGTVGKSCSSNKPTIVPNVMNPMTQASLIIVSAQSSTSTQQVCS